MENEEKNVEVGYGKPPKGKPFTSENQPSPEAKSKGVKEYWNRKKEAQELMDGGKKYLDMSSEEFALLEKDIEENPQNYTTRDIKIIEHIRDSSFIKDWLDRNVGKAPTEFKGEVKNITIEDIRNAFDEDLNDEGENYEHQSSS
jgi:hypothetical protein